MALHERRDHGRHVLDHRAGGEPPPLLLLRHTARHDLDQALLDRSSAARWFRYAAARASRSNESQLSASVTTSCSSDAVRCQRPPGTAGGSGGVGLGGGGGGGGLGGGDGGAGRCRTRSRWRSGAPERPARDGGGAAAAVVLGQAWQSPVVDMSSSVAPSLYLVQTHGAPAVQSTDPGVRGRAAHHRQQLLLRARPRHRALRRAELDVGLRVLRVPVGVARRARHLPWKPFFAHLVGFPGRRLVPNTRFAHLDFRSPGGGSGYISYGRGGAGRGEEGRGCAYISRRRAAGGAGGAAHGSTTCSFSDCSRATLCGLPSRRTSSTRRRSRPRRWRASAGRPMWCRRASGRRQGSPRVADSERRQSLLPPRQGPGLIGLPRTPRHPPAARTRSARRAAAPCAPRGSPLRLSFQRARRATNLETTRSPQAT